MDLFELPLFVSPPHPCPYLPDREATDLVAFTDAITATMYQSMMDNGFRRSGDIFYRPICKSCDRCIPIRVPVADFQASRSQRRVLKRNQDITVTFDPLTDSDEHYDLFRRYQDHQHDENMIETRAGFVEAFTRAPITAVAINCRTEDGRLVGSGIIDVTPACLSSVYFYFDPDEARRGLGTFSALMEIEECRRRALPWWYIGFVVEGCGKMTYKTRFRPYETLDRQGAWVRSEG